MLLWDSHKGQKKGVFAGPLCGYFVLYIAVAVVCNLHMIEEEKGKVIQLDVGNEKTNTIVVK